MKTKLTNSIAKGHVGYGAGPGIIELLEYECPCGKGKIVEEHFVNIYCNDCCDKYELNIDLGVHSWNLHKSS